MNFQSINKIHNKDSKQFFLIAGPCAIESEKMALTIAEKLVYVTDKLKIPFIFKGSFKKANRSRIDSFSGIGDEIALKILEKVGTTFNIPTLTDIHEKNDAETAANYVDVLQIPAFLVRQTELVVAAAKTGKIVNLKKGQFMSPNSMNFAAQKVKDSGNSNYWLTERGTQFGYNDLIVDFRGIEDMQKIGPTILDVTHSLQKPNQNTGITGGHPEKIESLARAGISVGVDGIFIETHFDPKTALSDGANMLDISLIENLLKRLTQLRSTINSFN
jgi:2-dehydro-3-deoxyphosphooctonate aldolase (KDO 8-P synthase)